MTDTGRPDRNGLMGDCDCMTLWTIQAAEAAGIDHAVFCAVLSDAASMAAYHLPTREADKRLREGYSELAFNWTEDRKGNWQAVECRAKDRPGSYFIRIAFWGPR
jgi:hypothetical protein